jgi:hypothetical protein
LTTASDGALPTVTVATTVLEITDTVVVPQLVTYTYRPSGVTVTPAG